MLWRILGALLVPGLAWADPSCETVYWGEVFDGKLGTDFGLLPLDAAAPEGATIAARGADQGDPEALASCPAAYTIVDPPRLGLIQDGEIFDIPQDWSKNADFYEALVIEDPSGLGAGTVTIFWDAGEVLVPLRTILPDSSAAVDGPQRIMDFEEIAARFPEGDGLLFVHDFPGPLLTTHYMRWSVH